jgi:outer membrane receptor for ferrienterochelin and colicin
MRNIQANAVSLAGMAMVLAGSAGAAQAQQAATTAAPKQEAIVVTGLRKSLADAVNIKRNTQGVVDAITSEDIGKMPDTNLAESIQRIPGVSIDRANNEGSRVTVRGLGRSSTL